MGIQQHTTSNGKVEKRVDERQQERWWLCCTGEVQADEPPWQWAMQTNTHTRAHTHKSTVSPSTHEGMRKGANKSSHR